MFALTKKRTEFREGDLIQNDDGVFIFLYFQDHATAVVKDPMSKIIEAIDAPIRFADGFDPGMTSCLE